MPFWNRKKHSGSKSSQDRTQAQNKSALPAVNPEDREAVTIHESGEISLHVTSVPEAKLAIKQLRLRKKELGAEKGQINTEMAEIRTERRQEVAKQKPIRRGRGSLGRIRQGVQRDLRAYDRAEHANRLAPFERQKAVLDQRIMMAEQAIYKLEAYILEQTSDGK